ncbi:hypothetical protein DYB34_009757 [Aphanomyces astaci]|uniref:MYND-type domain-containing protein n=1 Tax=Aphanomyces astaci TaxID=112090 RepID=A0A397FMT3_APHAT|nr:hypothetical protein DYB34_009757 [Aphanomyces astaci]RHZ31885.1 hypothetical protein DYB31_005773 [Aphanomyces astaci]
MNDLINSLLPADAGVQCMLHPVFGASLYTTRAFDIGEIVWQEDAALLSSGSSVLAYAKVFKNHSAADLSRILSGFMTLDESTINADPTFSVIARLCSAFRKSHAAHLPLVTQLVSAFEINGHGLLNDTAGLFTVASKAAHSCSPNVIYKPRGDAGMAYVAITPLAPDSLVYYSYIAREKLGYSSHFRQVMLRQLYYFTCGCARCAGVDHVRPLKCPTCAKDILRSAATASWSCASCATVVTDAQAPLVLPLTDEDALENTVMGFDILVDSATVTKVRAAFRLASKTLSMNHWTVIYLSRILVEMSIPPSTNHMAPALTSPQLKAMSKRIAMWCADVLAPHNGVSAAGLVFMYQGILFAQSRTDPEVRAALTSLYPYFRLNFDPNDDDVVEWRGLVWSADLQEVETRYCAHCTKPATLRCARCTSVAYCSKECQVLNWKGHKRVCPKLKSHHAIS